VHTADSMERKCEVVVNAALAFVGNLRLDRGRT
jgi:hypothetical protein